MARKKRQFPLIADDELVISTAPQMQLYDNEDLINNIHGNYEDKDYSDSQGNSLTQSSFSKTQLSDLEAGKSYAELAREEAKKDLKRKRKQHIAQEAKIPTKPNFQHREETKKPAKPTVFFNGEMVGSKPADLSSNGLARFSRNLHQDTYILAELPKVYQKPENPSTKAVKKNNYDFLKRSQIYNQEETRQRQTHQVAKELNLMFDGE